MDEVQKLQEKLREWEERLDGADHLAIWKQINEMLWTSAFYRSINESRKYIRKGGAGQTLANGTLHELIDDGYITIHAVALRRLLDRRKGTNSMINLIRDIKNNSTLLTRGNMLQARGLVYDFQAAKDRAHYEAHSKAQALGEKAYFISGDGWSDAECWHMHCDELCGTQPVDRDPSDRPSARQFQRLIDDLLGAGREVVEYVNHHIAHAACRDRRIMLNPGYNSLSLAKLWKGERAIVRVAGFVSCFVVHGASAGNVPVPQFDQFQYLDGPFVMREAMVHLNRAWEEHANEIEECGGWTWNLPLEA